MFRLARVFAVVALMTPSPIVAEPQKPAVLAGRWTGDVTADRGVMTIEVTLTVDRDKITGDIKTGHGLFQIEKGDWQKDGRWKLAFVTEDGVTGSLTGAVKDDTFAGDWDFRPTAVGTFSLKRAK